MRKNLLLITVSWCLLLVSAQAGRTPGTQWVSSRLEAQQQLTVDLAAAVFTAFHDAYQAGLTNMILAGSVLTAFTNGLDAANQKDVVEAVNAWSTRQLAVLDTFLIQQGEMNRVLREQLVYDMQELLRQETSQSVQAYVNGLVQPDTISGSVELVDQTTLHAATEGALTVNLSPREYLPGVPSRYAARLLCTKAAAVNIKTAPGYSVYCDQEYPGAPAILRVEQVSSSAYVAEWRKLHE